MTKILAKLLKNGDKVMPPARELRLWMKATAKERNLSEDALILTIVDIKEGHSDKKGGWLVISAEQTPEWNQGRSPSNFIFWVRPTTLYPVVNQITKGD